MYSEGCTLWDVLTICLFAHEVVHLPRAVVGSLFVRLDAGAVATVPDDGVRAFPPLRVLSVGKQSIIDLISDLFSLIDDAWLTLILDFV